MTKYSFKTLIPDVNFGRKINGLFQHHSNQSKRSPEFFLLFGDSSCIIFCNIKTKFQLKITACSRKVCRNVLQPFTQSRTKTMFPARTKCGKKLCQEKLQHWKTCQAKPSEETDEASQSLRVQSHRMVQSGLQLQQEPTSEELVWWSTVTKWLVRRKRIQAAGSPPRCFHSQWCFGPKLQPATCCSELLVNFLLQCSRRSSLVECWFLILATLPHNFFF